MSIINRVTFEDRMQRIEHNLDLLAAAQERLSAADEQIAASEERLVRRLEASEERVAAALERLANNDVLIINSIGSRAEWEARMAARAELHEKNLFAWRRWSVRRLSGRTFRIPSRY